MPATTIHGGIISRLSWPDFCPTPSFLYSLSLKCDALPAPASFAIWAGHLFWLWRRVWSRSCSTPSVEQAQCVSSTHLPVHRSRPALVVEWLAIRSPKVERLFGSLITIVAVVVAVALLAAPFQPWLSEVSLIASLLSAVAVGTVVIIARHSGPVKSTLAMIATIYTAIGIAILPP